MQYQIGKGNLKRLYNGKRQTFIAKKLQDEDVVYLSNKNSSAAYGKDYGYFDSIQSAKLIDTKSRRGAYNLLNRNESETGKV